jgi:hypothetical protein
LDGVLFDKNTQTLPRFMQDKSGDYVILNSVTAIGKFAFNDCGKSTAIVILNPVTTIGESAFISHDDNPRSATI